MVPVQHFADLGVRASASGANRGGGLRAISQLKARSIAHNSTEALVLCHLLGGGSDRGDHPDEARSIALQAENRLLAGV
jgi:hypothetical protein